MQGKTPHHSFVFLQAFVLTVPPMVVELLYCLLDRVFYEEKYRIITTIGHQRDFNVNAVANRS